MKLSERNVSLASEIRLRRKGRVKRLRAEIIFAGFIFFIYSAAVIRAQDLSISASASSRSITINEQVKLTISISGSSGKLPGLNLPPLGDFDVYSSGTSQNVSIINGKVSSAYNYTFVLVPKKQGSLRIPAFQINFKGKKYTTDPITVEVRAAGTPSPRKGQANVSAHPSSPAPPQAKSFWIKQSFNKRECFVGEPVYYTFYFYRDRGLASNPSLQMPDFRGFLKEDLPPPKRYNTSINGKNYYVTEIKEVIYPIKAGRFTFSPAQLQIVESNFPSFDDDFFSGFFGGGRRKNLQTEPLSLTVKRLPEKGKPANYKGDVGKFKISASVDKNRLKAGDALKLTVKIEGSGNISSITQPDFPEFANFRQYEVISSHKIQKNNYKVTGSKEFQTVLVPRVAGTLDIPPIRYSYFDPSSGKYRMLKTKDIKITALPAPNRPENPQYATTLKEVGKDIRHITPVDGLRRGEGFIADNFRKMIILPFFMFLVLAGVKSGVYEKIFPAASIARRKALASAAKAVKKAPEDPAGMGGEFEKIAVNFIKARTGIKGVSSVRKVLKERKVPGETVSSVTDFIKQCQSARFAPENFKDSKEACSLRLMEILKELKKYI